MTLPAAQVVHKLSWWRRLLRLTKSTTLTTYHHEETGFHARVMTRAYEKETQVWGYGEAGEMTELGFRDTEKEDK